MFLPTWVDTDLFYPISNPKKDIKKELAKIDKRLSEDKRWILFVGRLQKQKAPLRLIQTFAEYNYKKTDCQLLIIGEGNLKRIMQIKIRIMK